MNDTEAQAYELVRQREWYGAAELFDQLLVPAFLKGTPKERLVSYLLGRSECLLELGRHEAVVSDCQRVIKLLADANASNSESRAWKRLVHALYYLQRFAEAEAATQEWLAVSGGAANQPDAVKMLERLRIAYQASNGQNKQHMNHCNPVLEDDILALDTRLESWTGISPQRQRKHPVELLSEPTVEPDSKQVNARRKLLMEPINSSHQLPEAFVNQKDSTQTQAETSRELVCTYCCLKFNDRSDLRSHCQSEG
jgi:tetratricopeptide (TPR) repeat protein